MRMFGQYLKNNIWDTILGAIISALLVQAICRGCYISRELTENMPAIFLSVLLLQIIMVLGSYNRRSIVFSLVFFLAAALGMVYYLRGNLNDTGGVLYAFIALAVAATVFLLSRSRAGSGLVFLIGSIVLAGAAFLQYSQSIPAFLLFLWAAASLFFYRSYRSQLLKLEAAKPAFTSYFLTVSIISALILMVGLSVQFYVIRPLDPPTRELKLITRLMSLEVVKKIGVSSEIYLIDEEQVSARMEDSDRISSVEGEIADDSTAVHSPDEGAAVPQPGQGLMERIWGSGPDGENALAISYEHKSYFILFTVLGLVLVIAGAICLKQLQRKMWYRQLLKKDRKQQVNELYHFFLKRLQQVGFPGADSDTPKEYAERMKVQLDSFSGGECDFGIISDIFTSSCYGDLQPEEKEYQQCLQFYSQFYSNSRKQLGNTRYALKYFTI